MRAKAKSVRVAREEDYAAPKPLYVVWELTLKCDLSCKHCGSRAGKARPRELTTDECFRVVAELAEAGTREITIIGGEAYLRADWAQIAARITESGIRCSMTTGARNLSQERVDEAARAGIRNIAISLDGLEKTHDAQRGVKGSWAAAVAAAKRVSASPIRLSTNSQVNRLSLPEIPAIADTMIEIGSKAWQVQVTVAMGRAADRPDLLLQPYDLLELFPLLLWVKEHKLDPHGISLQPGNNLGYFSPYESLLRHYGDEGAHWQGCPAGKFGLGLESDGTLKGCPSLSTKEYAGGNVLDTPLATILRDAPEITHIAKRTRDDLWGFCKTCYYGDVCLGGCTWTAQSLLGRAGNNPYCIHRALEFERQGLRERVMPVSAAPGEPFDHGIFTIEVESMPAGPEEPSILGIPIRTVLGAGFADPALINEALREARLRASL